MSKKRTSEEPKNDDETNENSGYEASKRARLDLQSDTTLQDLPKELLEDIFIKAVAMEVKGLRLAKSVWNEKADLVINRLRTVSSQWSTILTADCFRQRIHRTLDGTAAPVVRLEILHESRVMSRIHGTTTTKDEIFMFWKVPECLYYFIIVYNRSNILEVKDIVSPPEDQDFICIAACHVSNCLYAGIYTWNQDSNWFSIARISKTTGNQKYSVSPWITDHRFKISMVSVSVNGNLIIHSGVERREQSIITIHDVNGSLQHEIVLAPELGISMRGDIFQKSNGNLILAYFSYKGDGTRSYSVMEIDTTGNVLRRHDSSFSYCSKVNVADTYGRILITDASGRMELIDSEFNPLGTYGFPQDQGKRLLVHASHYDSERNEIVRIHEDGNIFTTTSGLTIFRLIED